MSKLKRVLALFLTVALVTAAVPGMYMEEAWADVDTRIADASTMDSWKTYFGESDTAFTTRYAGHVWTDKSVLTGAGALSYAKEKANGTSTISLTPGDTNNFLVSLSAMAASEAISGQANKPTDTMIILDLSSSMYNGSSRTPDSVKIMVDAVNDTIDKLQKLNQNNKVGVTIYFGGGTILNSTSTKSCGMVLLPLDRYVRNGSSSDKQFLKINTSGGKLQSVQVNSGVKNSAGSTVAQTKHTVADIAGTYAQLGILHAMDEFLKADPVIPASASYQAGVTKTPVFIFMSDGEPTAATHQYWDKTKTSGMGNNRVVDRNPNQTDFVTQLTAAYAKMKVDARYAETTPLFYTLSLGSSISKEVMDPANHTNATINGYWNNLVNNGKVNIKVQNFKTTSPGGGTTETTYTVSKREGFPSKTSQRLYVDKTFTAATASQLTSAFDNIFAQIELQTHTYPTLVQDDENLDGYVSFVDKIGHYMNVTDVKGILIGTSWYSGREMARNMNSLSSEMIQAVQKRLNITSVAEANTLISLAKQEGQLAYSQAAGTFSNYIGWYADAAGNYVGFWHEGSTNRPDGAVYKIKSYGYLGETDESHGVSDSDLMYATVQHRTHLDTGEETMTFAVPAALIPTVEYNVELNQNGTVKSMTRGGADYPVRLVYEVALDDAINEMTVEEVVSSAYLNSHTNSDGSIRFYTNQFEADHSVGYGKVNTYSYFRPAHTNENYYFQENAAVYKDQNGTRYTGTSQPDGTFYRAVKVYKRSGNSLSEETIYRRLADEVLEVSVKTSSNTWYIPKGSVYVNMDGYTITKAAVGTDTLPNANTPFVDVYGHKVTDTNHRFVIGETLGNNGKVTVIPAAGILLEKKAEGGGASDAVFTFTVSAADVGLAGTFKATRISAGGNASAGTLTFTAGTAEASIKSGEKLYITGLPAGAYTIREADHADFVLSSIQVNGTSLGKTATEAAVTVENQDIEKVTFTNVPRKTGTLTVAKLVEAEAGSGNFADKTFTIQVKLDGIAVKPNDQFDVLYTGAESPVKAVLDANKTLTLTLKDKQEAEISGIPEGTQATVTEILDPASDKGFTAKYTVNRGTPSAEPPVVTVVKAPALSTVTVTNTYSPAAAAVKINLEGKKFLLDADGNLIAEKNMAAQWPKDSQGKNIAFQFVVQKYENGTWVNTEDVFTLDGTNGNEIDFGNEPKELTFDKPGRYGYQVIEKNHGQTIDGITYDATMHTFDVVVEDDGSGQLKAVVESTHGTSGTGFSLINGIYTNTNINFTNRNSQQGTSALIMIQKKMDNQAGSSHISLEGYQFELYECNDDFTLKNAAPKIITTPTDISGESYVFLEYAYGEQGTHYYKLKEKKTDIAGMTDSVEYYNFKVTVSKDTADDSKVQAAVESVLDSDTENSDRGFGTYNDTAAGVTYKLATFTNTYKPASAEVVLDVTKKLEGRPLAAGEFTFKLEPKNGAPAPASTTAANDADGDVDFGELTFSRVGTYTYTVSEVKPAAADALTDVTYDENVYDLVITVTDDKSGTLRASVNVLNIPGSTIVFENTYRASTPVSITAEGSKSFINWKGEPMHMTSGQFTFLLQESDAAGNVKAGGYSDQAENRADGTFAFEQITYRTAGTRYYVISEQVPASTYGIQYDPAKYLLKAEVTYDPGSKTLSADKSISRLGLTPGTGDDKAVFTNRYVPAGAAVTIPAFKTLEGKQLADNMFTFNLYTADSSWTKDTSAAPLTAANKADGTVTFTVGPLSEEGTYYYIMEEVSSGLTGYTYDSKKVGVMVTVTDNQLGQMTADISYAELTEETIGENQTAVTAAPADSAAFKNSYEAKPTDPLALTGRKTVTGTGAAVLLGGEYTFRLKGLDGAPMPAADTVTNAADGTFAFGEVIYTMEGTYRYTISEVYGGMTIGGTAYDPAVYYVDVTVTDNGGQLTAAASYQEASSAGLIYGSGLAEFVNDCDPSRASVTLKGHKNFTGRELTAGDNFTFSLVQVTSVPSTDPAASAPVVTETPVGTATMLPDGTIIFPALTFTEAGTWNYIIRETAGTAAGITYDTAEYDVVITTTSGSVLDAAITVNGIPYTDPEQTNIIFNNQYKAADGEIIITAAKTLTGRTLQADDFTFELLDGEGNLLQTAKNSSSGVISFSPIIFTDGQEGRYVYTVREVNEGLGGVTYDPAEHKIILDVEDDGSGLLKIYHVVADTADGSETKTLAGNKVQAGTFNNKYGDETGAAYLNLQAFKVLDGRSLKAGEFGFQITGSAGAPLPQETTAWNREDGTVNFGAIKFEQAGPSEGYTYTITEIIPEDSQKLPGVTYDTSAAAGQPTAYTVNVKVEAGAAGEPLAVKIEDTLITRAYNVGTFHNRYDAAGSVIIEAFKQMDGRSLNAGEFSFVLTDVTDPANPVELETTSNGADGSIVFGRISYTLPGTYTYTVREAAGSLANVTYDTSVKTVVVEVTDNGDGTLKAQDGGGVDGYAFAGQFVNRYDDPYTPGPTPSGIWVSVSAHKVMEGRPLAAGEFSFELRDAEGNVLQTRTNTSTGAVFFSSLYFDEAGTYRYTVNEAAGSEEGVTYDTAVYTVDVTVTETPWGSISAEILIDGAADGSITFTNTFEEKPEDPEEPKDPEEPENPGTPGSPDGPDDEFTELEEETPHAGRDPEHPKTGDANQLMLWLLVCAVSGMGAAGLWRKVK